MMNFARAMSFLLGPWFVLLPVPYVLVSKFTDSHIYALKWMFFSYAFILAVGAFVAIGVFIGVFSNFDVSKREQRPLLFLFTGFTIFCYVLSLLILNGPKILFVGVFAFILGLIIVFIINKWIKTSIHLAILTSFVLLICSAYGRYYFFLLLLIPLLAWSRIKMKEHTLLETIVGTILGALITLMMYTISKYFLVGML